MPNLTQRGATWLGGKLKTAGGRSVVYRRGAVISSPIVGTVGRHEYDVTDNDGITTTVVMDDWIFTATDLVLDAVQIEPRVGDYIEETLNGFTNQYQVLPVNDRPAWEWFDTSGILLRVHSKRVKRTE